MNRSMLAGIHQARAIGAWSIALLLGGAFLWASPALASCGSAVCSVNTDWAAHGSWSDPGFKLDGRGEYVPQDQLMEGSKKVSHPTEAVHHEEVHTWNRNLNTTLDYTFNDKWGVSVAVPYIDRDHKHIHNHMGSPEVEKWHITGVGDARVLGRYQVMRDTEGGSAAGVQLGVKLPT
ncbi:MAG TPA: hypothetical protein VF678_01285, partial [bacterium]